VGGRLSVVDSTPDVEPAVCETTRRESHGAAMEVWKGCLAGELAPARPNVIALFSKVTSAFSKAIQLFLRPLKDFLQDFEKSCRLSWYGER
jgi:hypothetical protein